MRVDEPQLGGVEEDPRSGQPGPVVAPDVDALAHDGVTRLGEMDPDLVGASGLELAAEQARAGEPFDPRDVGDGELALGGGASGAAEPVAPVGHETRAEGAIVDVTVGDGEVLSMHAVDAELLRQVLLRVQVAGEDEQSRSVLVEAVHDAQCALYPAALRATLAREVRAHELVQGAGLRLVEGDGAHPGRLPHHDDVRVDVRHDLPTHALARGWSRRSLAHGDLVARPHEMGGHEDELVSDRHLAGRDQVARLAPAEPREHLSQGGVERSPAFAGRDLVGPVSYFGRRHRQA